MPRACVIVLDAVGAGELPDAHEYGDAGSDTLGNVARAVGGLDLPNLEALGLGNVEPLLGCPPQPGAPAVAGRLVERSKGKDTTTGHWELMGVVTPQPMPTYPHGFPHDVIDPFMHRTGRGVVGNKPASGTEIIQELGEEHQRTGKWIVYTSADSVFQIAAHEETIPLEELYEGCKVAREILTGKHAVGRVIARPFTGAPGHFTRTGGRRDFSLDPPRDSYLVELQAAGVAVHGVGKIRDLFAGVGIDRKHTATTNDDGLAVTTGLLRELRRGLIFTNLVETDQVHGHRHDVAGFAHALEQIDRAVAEWLDDCLGPGDLLVLTADHGVDPTAPHSDHTREYAPLLAVFGGHHGRRHDGPLADVGASALRWLTGRTADALPGESFVGG
jgi:phosphopentomutase